MAKIGKINHNKKRETLAARQSAKRARLKAIVHNRDLPMEERFDATMRLAAMPRNGAKNRVHNRCELTGRPHAYYRAFKLCRIKLRELASSGQIPGVIKASW